MAPPQAPPQPPTLHLIVIRHGERLDQTDSGVYLATSAEPFNPPLTAKGKQQAVSSGSWIAADFASFGPFKRIWVLTSPFKRCCETSEGLLQGLAKGAPAEGAAAPAPAPPVAVGLEGAFGEFLSNSLFQGPPPIAPFVKDKVQETFPGLPLAASPYSPYINGISSVWPETVEHMKERFTTSLDYAVTQIQRYEAEAPSTPAAALAAGEEKEPDNVGIVIVTHAAGFQCLVESLSECILGEIPHCSMAKFFKEGTGQWTLAKGSFTAY